MPIAHFDVIGGGTSAQFGTVAFGKEKPWSLWLKLRPEFGERLELDNGQTHRDLEFSLALERWSPAHREWLEEHIAPEAIG